MEASPENQPPPAGPPTQEAGGRPRVSFMNVFTLLVLAVGVPAAGYWFFSKPGLILLALAVLGAVLPPILVPLAVTHAGRKRGWPAASMRYASIAFVALWIASLVVVAGRGMTKLKESSKLKAMIPRQMSAAVDQFYLEYDYRIFASYRDLVGPRQYIKAYHPTDGEDPSIQFPIRRDWITPLPVRLPDGTTVQRYEVFAAVGQSGLIAMYPRPQVYSGPDDYNPDRVYRLDCGVSYRGNRVVDLPPDPAGREGRDQDGVHVYQLADGRRFEITYHGGVPDGPFRAFFPDGRPWGEATYQKGRLVGPSWLILRDGRKIDELADGEAADAAMANDMAAAMREAKARDLLAKEAAQRAARPIIARPPPAPVSPATQPRGAPPMPPSSPEQTKLGAAIRKAAARDYAGAEAEVTGLIDSIAPKAGYFILRARYRYFQGNLDGALEDYGRAESLVPTLWQAAFERAHVLRAKPDLEGAAREYRALLEKNGKGFHPGSGRIALWLYVTDCARGGSDLARRELEDNLQALAALKKNDTQQAIANLDAQLARLLLGRTSEPEAEAAVNDAPTRAQTEFRFKFLFFSALARRLAGDEAGARERFQRALAAHHSIEGYDYERAEAEQALAGPVPSAPAPLPTPSL